MADQDYPVLYAQLQAELSRMKAVVAAAQLIIYGSSGNVAVPGGGTVPSVAKRVEDRMGQLVDQDPVNWSSIIDRPVNFPTTWDMVADKPDIGEGGGGGPVAWADVTGKPTSFPSAWATLANIPASFPSDWTTLGNIPTSFPSAWDSVSGKPLEFATSWTMVSGKPDNYPTTWDMVADKPSLSAGYSPMPVMTVNESITLGLTHANAYVRAYNSSALTFTIPAQASVAWADNTEIVIETYPGSTFTIATATGVTLNRDPRLPRAMSFAYGRVKLKRTDLNQWVLDYATMYNPMTTSGDLVVANWATSSAEPVRLAIGAIGQVLTGVNDGFGGVRPGWQTPSSALPIITDTTTGKTLALTDASKYVRMTSASPVTVTVPTQASVAWADNTEITIEQAGAGAVTIAAASGVTINRVATATAVIGGQYGVVTLKRTASNVWTLFGSLGTA